MFNTILDFITNYWWVMALVLSAVFYKAIFRLFGIVIVPEDKIGLVTKKFVLFGQNKELSGDRIIATNGEAGLQADYLSPVSYTHLTLRRRG